MDGIFNINKPSGLTSFDVVARVRRCSREKKVGHSGTLDPIAAGVLPVFLGRATRVIEYATDSIKEYRAQIEFGLTTDTFDFTGNIISREDPGEVTKEQITGALKSFLGNIKQKPPMFSAVKYRGAPLYKLARAGIAVEVKERDAIISRIDLISWDSPVATLDIECGKGTYIRSLAHDLGQLLGCGAVLKGLERLRSGIFHIEGAVALEDLETAFHYGSFKSYLYPMDIVLEQLPAIIVGDELGRAIVNGISVSLEGKILPGAKTLSRVYNGGGSLLGILRLNAETGLWHPEKIFSPLTVPDLYATNNIQACVARLWDSD